VVLYLDTSALVKLYVSERDSRSVRDQVAQAQACVTSAVTYAELRAALGRLQREGLLSKSQATRCRQAFDADWSKLVVLDVTDRLARHAGALAEGHALRGFDAIHLASAIEAEQLLGRSVEFLSFDQRQNQAASAVGLTVSGA